MTNRKISKQDLDALERAVAVTRRDPGRRIELDRLIKQQGWDEAAKVASYDAQCRSLRLKPWQEPPCSAKAADDPRAAHLLARLVERGLSRYEPNPLAAIAAAGGKAAA